MRSAPCSYIGLNDVDAVCLSHLHADHFIDMCSFWVARTYSPDGPQPRIPVYGPAAAAERVHPVETFAFRFEHGGRVLTYSGDTGPSPVLVELAGSADVLLCEAGFPEEPDLPPGLHLTGRQAGQHATAAGADQLILTHIAPDTDPARSLAEAQSTFPGPISLAVPGLVLDL